jgi:putrescine transport system substrate-binding protein
MSMRAGWIAILAAFFGHGASATFGAEPPVLNVYNWSDYISEEALKSFTEKTGIKVSYDVYDANEILEAKLLAGSSRYDVVFPSAMPYLANQIRAGIYRKLDRSLISHSSGVDPAVLQRLREADPSNEYALPYLMAGTGIGYNVDKIKALAPEAPLDSLSLIFDPKLLGKLKTCGMSILDAPEEVFPAALAWVGRDPKGASADDLKIASGVVEKARASYRYMHNSGYINDLANGAICVAMGYAGDLVQARERAREAGRGVNIRVVLPREGALFNIDVMAIPKDAPHPENAHKFINHLLEPTVIASITNKVGYANAVPASKAHVEKRMLEDPVVYPPASAKLYEVPLMSREVERTRNRAWTRIRSKY